MTDNDKLDVLIEVVQALIDVDSNLLESQQIEYDTIRLHTRVQAFEGVLKTAKRLRGE